MRSSLAVVAAVLMLACRSSADEHLPTPTVPAEEETTSDVELVTVDAGASISAPDESKVLSRFETVYGTSGRQGGRAENVRVAASRASFVLRPGETWSFNKAVGPRTKENGFVMAPVISDGEFVDDWGGGTCQVSSTVHAAAVMAGLEVLKRTSHSRPSSYVKPGLDATVLFPPECDGESRKGCYAADLSVRNPYDVPLAVRVTLVPKDKSRGTVVAEVLGMEPGFVVGYAWSPRKPEVFVQRFKRTPKVKAPRLKQRGSQGSGGVSTVTYAFPDGTKKIRKYESTYRPVDELWEVPEDWDESAPPPWEPADAGPQDSGFGDASRD